MAWIRDHAVAFRSVDPHDADFEDLQPLKDLIGDARVVQLGEQSHGDGTCFLNKIRLIRFLHQEMGFDVLSFESGLYDCHKAWQAFQAGEDALQAASTGVFGIWTGSAQTAPLWDYLAEQAAGDRPLELAGFDCQFTAAPVSLLLDDLHELAKKLGGAGISAGEWEHFDAELTRLRGGEDPEGSKEDFMKTLDRLSRAVQTAAADQAESGEFLFWRQQLESMADHCGRQWERPPAMDGVMARDHQMAKNLIWQIRKRYPQRKIIVWAASFHIMRNPPEIQVPGGQVDYEDMIQMGHRVHLDQGEQVFTIGFTAHSGRAGAWFRQGFEIGSPPDGTLESKIEAAGIVNGLVPFRGTENQAPWLHEFQYSRPLGYSWMKARWPRHFDAMIFNRQMEPSTR